MKGNVTCSCGHSWNTSDSSKKDVNVCHICGKDNTMKDGGWLDKYQDGGEVETPKRTALFNQDTLALPKNSYAKYTTDKEKSRLKGTSDNEEINKAADWLTNWYSSPGANRRLSESLKTEDPRQVLQDARDNINNVYVLRNSSRDLFNDDILENKSTDFNSLISKSYLLRSTINALKNEENYMSPTADDYTAGFYTPNGHIINITPGIDKKVIKGTSVHELTHASNLDKYYNNVGENILKKRPLARTNGMGLFPRFKQPKGTDQGDSQYIKRDGAYPRLMEMRYNSKINPNQVITPEQFKTIKKENPKNDLFRYYTDYDIINMLNHFAANDKPIQSDITTAEYGAELNYNDYSVSAPEGFVGDGYSNVGRNYSPAWGGQFKDGGKLSFIKDPKLRNMLEGYKPELLQTIDDYRLPEGYMAGSIYPSTEVSTSIGGEDGEPAYLIPSFKYGYPLQDPVQEFDMTGQYLGGPFKTWQDAEKFQEIRHQYVEKGQPLPSPIATSNMAMGGSLPGATGSMYARVGAPSKGKYRNLRYKTDASAQNGTEMRYYQEGLDFKPKSISKNGSELTKLDQLTNFTNYNTKQPGGWLDKYQ